MNQDFKAKIAEMEPKEILEVYFDAKCKKVGCINDLPKEIVDGIVDKLNEALAILPVYGASNKIVSHERYLELKKKIKRDLF
jgi:hypothetical protein